MRNRIDLGLDGDNVESDSSISQHLREYKSYG
jgi:hypothetical protein